MAEIFKIRRRAFGIVTLMLALVLTAGWVRSPFQGDFLVPYVSDETVEFIVSYRHGIKWIHSHDRGGKWSNQISSRWGSNPVVDSSTATVFAPVFDGIAPDWRWQFQWCGLYIAKAGMTANLDAIVVEVPYWWLTIPMTVLSTWLLLSKPRVAKKPELLVLEISTDCHSGS